MLTNVLIFFAIGSFVAFLTNVVLHFFWFDRILRIAYARHRERWEQLGRSCGYFWVPRKDKWQSSWVARERLRSEWTVHLPNWLDGDQDATDAHRIFRRTWIALYWLSVAYAVFFLMGFITIFSGIGR